MTNLSRILRNRKKILGLNERYLKYIRPNNLNNAIKIADNKVLTKKVLKKHEIPVPQKIAVIKSRKDIEQFNFDSLPRSFVLKPVRGARGAGIEIFYNKDKEGRWIRADKSKVDIDDIKGMCRDILDGKYSLFNEPDIVLFEERVVSHKAFKEYTYKGTPDIRVIVYNKIPIMSYIRIPTEESEGKANLDLGAIGAGIDMAVGKTTYAIKGKSQRIEYVPNKNHTLSGLKIPFWDRILRYSVETSIATDLGFGAIDFLIDKDKGPMVVELNARPGLSIQLANDDGLRWRLRKARGLKVKNVAHGVRLGKDLFGGEIEEEIESMSGKRVIGLVEEVKIWHQDSDNKEIVNAKIDTGADSSSIDKELAIKLGYSDIVQALEERNLPKDLDRKEGIEMMKTLSNELKPKFEQLQDINFVKSSHGSSLRASVYITIEMDNFKFETTATIANRKNLEHSVIIGRKSLSNFLIDTSKN